MVLVLTAGAGFGWFVRSAHVQREAVLAIERAGGTVIYNWELADHGMEPILSHRWSRWMLKYGGIDSLDSVRA